MASRADVHRHAVERSVAALGLRPVSPPGSLVDAVDTRGGRYRLIGRTATPGGRAGRVDLGPGKADLDFDVAVVVLFDQGTLKVWRAYRVPIAVIRRYARLAPSIDRWWLYPGKGFRADPNVEDVTAAFASSRSRRVGVATTDWDLDPGDVIRRTELHARFGGRRQGGIAMSTRTPNVLVFSDARTGRQHGYLDRWEGDTFLYTGEGQRGDQQMTGGNRAIREHANQGRALRVFQGASGEVQYQGEFQLAEPAWVHEYAPETGNGPPRLVIVFRLRRNDQATTLPKIRQTARRTYAPGNEHPKSPQADPWTRDPDKVDRGLASHAFVQNSLQVFLSAHGVEAGDPMPGEPDCDLIWSQRSWTYVAEVKSLTQGNEVRQLRLGLGQVLHYQDQMLRMSPRVRAVLAVEHAPTDRAWVSFCARLGVLLVWPDNFEALLSRSIA